MNTLLTAVVLLLMLALIGGTTWYLSSRVWLGLSGALPQLRPAVPAGVFLVLMLLLVLGFMRSMLPVPPAVKKLLGTVSSYWMGLFVYLLLFFLLSDAVLLVVRLTGLVPSPVPGGVRFAAVAAAMLLAVAVTVGGVVHARQIHRADYEIRLDDPGAAAGVHIALISDLHLGAVGSEERLGRTVDAVNALRPDIICIAGDIFDNDFSALLSPAQTLAQLQRLEARYGVYACPGNHDAGETAGQMLEFLERTGVRVLCDEWAVIDNRFILAGRLDSTPIGGFGKMVRRPTGEVLAGVDTALPLIVLDHNPANIGEYGTETDLVLCGHTHKGQIFPAGLVTDRLFAVDYGWYRRDPQSPQVVVTSGAGTWGMPMRVGSDCEIVSIKLK